MPTPSLLLFDLGGVLVESALFAGLRRLPQVAGSESALKVRWLLSPAVRRFELGAIAPDEFAGQFLAEWNIAMPPEAFLEEFVSWPVGFYPQALETVARLRKTYRVACLSNTNSLHWEKFGGFDGIFDLSLFSHQLGVIKPDRQAFELAIARSGAQPADIYFFDDSPVNVRSAQSLGMQAFHAEGFAAVQDILQRLGLS